MYREFIFRPRSKSGERIYPEDARRLTAAALDGFGIDPGIFHRDEFGKTRQGVVEFMGPGIQPGVVFDSGMGFIRLYGIGPAGADLLEAQASKILRGLTAALGPTSCEIKEGFCTLEDDPEKGSVYFIRKMVIAKKPVQIQKYFRTPIEQVREDIARTIARGLLSTASLLDGQDLGGKVDLKARNLVGRLPYEKSIVVKSGEPCPVMIAPGVAASGYQHIEVFIPARISGPWQAGLLRSRGYGFIRLSNPNRERRQS